MARRGILKFIDNQSQNIRQRVFRQSDEPTYEPIEDDQPIVKRGRKKKNDTDNLPPPVYVPVEQKIDVEIADIIRIKPSDFSALKDSFEEWASKWN
jgi:hypothetical protein